jgi:DEAD/DEAH box helicase domain-containing protein
MNKIPFPICKECDKSDEAALKFQGYRQEHRGFRRFIYVDGTKTTYDRHKDAKGTKTLFCLTCMHEVDAQDMENWSRRYKWEWQTQDPIDDVIFDAGKTADDLVRDFKSRGADPVRIKIEQSTIKFADFPLKIDKNVSLLVKKKLKSDKLYHYQALSLNALYKDNLRGAVVSAPTGAGKSLIYQLYFLDRLANTKSASMLALFPTQALVLDQVKSFIQLASEDTKGSLKLPDPLTVNSLKVPQLNRLIEYSIFSGTDDENEGRSTGKILKRLGVLNCLWATPDKVFVHLYKSEFTTFLNNLEIIVIDEAHMATGIFGGNYAFLIRRLLKLAPNAKVLMMSATFKDARQFAIDLSGLEPKKLEFIQDPMAKFEREILMVPLWRPKDSKSKDIDKVVESTTAVLETLATIINSNGKKLPNGIVFGRSKRGLDALLKYIKGRSLDGSFPVNVAKDTRIYKRDIELRKKTLLLESMHDDEIRLMLATNALELGIDVGGVDFVILDSLPDTEISLIQRIGRAGRRRAGLAVVFIEPSPYHEYWLRQLRKAGVLRYEDIRTLPIAINNQRVIAANYLRFNAEAHNHLNMSEKDILSTYRRWTNQEVDKILKGINESKKSIPNYEYIIKMIKDPITNNLVNMRVALSMDEIPIIVKKTGRKIGQISRDVFFRDLHLNAIWRDHEGCAYKVIEYKKNKEFPVEAFVAIENSERSTCGLCKLVTSEIPENPMIVLVKKDNFSMQYGPVRVQEKFPGYFETINQKKEWRDLESEPEMKKIRRPVYETIGLQMQSNKWIESQLELAPIIGLYSLLKSFGPHFVGASESDIKIDFDAEKGLIILIDGSTGGNGVTHHVLKELSQILKLCEDAIHSCACKDGCFKCIVPKNGALETDIAFTKSDVAGLIKQLTKWVANVVIPADYTVAS